ncbi:MAG: hypothetical protein QXF82_02945 [Nitrososphaeria archaeon]
MLIEWMVNLGVTLFDVVMSMLGVLPDLPESIIGAIDFMFDTMFSAVSLASIFLDFNMVKILIPLAIAIFNFDAIFKFIMFILKKIPILDIK